MPEKARKRNCFSPQVSSITAMAVSLNVSIYRVEICSPWCNIQKQICHPLYGEITITADRDISKPQVMGQETEQILKLRGCDSSPQTPATSLSIGGCGLTPVFRDLGNSQDQEQRTSEARAARRRGLWMLRIGKTHRIPCP